MRVFCACLLFGAATFAAEVRVPASEAVKAAVSKVQPEYSQIARQMKVSGAVEVEATVDEAGKVETVKAVSGNPILTQSAVAAVQKWKFTPFTQNGQPSRAIATLRFDFRP